MKAESPPLIDKHSTVSQFTKGDLSDLRITLATRHEVESVDELLL